MNRRRQTGSCAKSELVVHELRKAGVFAANGGYARGLYNNVYKKHRTIKIKERTYESSLLFLFPHIPKLK